MIDYNKFLSNIGEHDTLQSDSSVSRHNVSNENLGPRTIREEENYLQLKLSPHNCDSLLTLPISSGTPILPSGITGFADISAKNWNNFLDRSNIEIIGSPYPTFPLSLLRWSPRLCALDPDWEKNRDWFIRNDWAYLTELTRIPRLIKLPAICTVTWSRADLAAA